MPAGHGWLSSYLINSTRHIYHAFKPYPYSSDSLPQALWIKLFMLGSTTAKGGDNAFLDSNLIQREEMPLLQLKKKVR
jgi:hypothetical protein